MVAGFRYNARVLARHIAAEVFGVELPRPHVPAGDVVRLAVRDFNHTPELAFQKGYLARVLRPSEGGAVDEGIVPLEVFVDGERDGAAVTLEFDADETIRPMLYVRHRGVLHEEALPPHPLRRYEGPEYDEPLAKRLRPLLGE
jgi:hypothetical protein